MKLQIPELEVPDILPEEIPLDILYEDTDLLVVNKPKGWSYIRRQGIIQGLWSML